MSVIHWRYIDDPPARGDFNMATDFALLKACNEGIGQPTLRLYGWVQPTLSLGYSRSGGNTINLKRCQQQQISIIRRPTGGRIILHHKELTYSIVAPIGHPSFPKGLQNTHHIISQALADCLNQLNLNGAALVCSKPKLNKKVRLKMKTCFGLSNRFEITVNGKKVVGSAQRRLNNAFLQHGSIMLFFDPEKLNQLLCFPNQEAEESHLKQLKHTTTDLQTLCHDSLSFVDLKSVFFQNLSQTLTKKAIFGKVTDYEKNIRNRSLVEYWNLSKKI